MTYQPTVPTLKYERTATGELTVRDIWYKRGNFYLEGVEHELASTPMNTDIPFDTVIVRLEQELKQISNYIPSMELAISVMEAYLTLPDDIREVAGQPVSPEVLERMLPRLEPIELDILSVNRVANLQVHGHGDALDFMTIIDKVMLLVHHRLYQLKQQGYYLGCKVSSALDIILVRPY